MREERRRLAGDQTIAEAMDLRGSVGGNVTVARGGKLYVRGAIYGDLNVLAGGRVHIYGHVQGSVHIGEESKVIHSGVVGGDLINTGGRLRIDRIARTGGKIKTISGQTTYQADEEDQEERGPIVL